MKSFKGRKKSLQDPPKLFFQFLMGKDHYAQVDLALTSGSSKKKGSCTDSAVALEFI